MKMRSAAAVHYRLRRKEILNSWSAPKQPPGE
jgi:hypothetical protein